MDRRDVLKYTAYLTGYAVTASLSSAILSGCTPEPTAPSYAPVFFTEEEFGGISALAEAMLPKTSTPGAGEVGVPAFIDVVLGKYTEAEDQQRIRTGLNSWLSGVATAAGKAYTELAAEEQNRLLNELDSSSKLAAEELAEQQLSPEEARSKAPWWLDMKSLMIGGYFSSEKVGTEVLAYDPVPGSYQGCIPLADVGSSWSL